MVQFRLEICSDRSVQFPSNGTKRKMIGFFGWVQFIEHNDLVRAVSPFSRNCFWYVKTGFWHRDVSSDQDTFKALNQALKKFNTCNLSISQTAYFTAPKTSQFFICNSRILLLNVLEHLLYIKINRASCVHQSYAALCYNNPPTDFLVTSKTFPIKKTKRKVTYFRRLC